MKNSLVDVKARGLFPFHFLVLAGVFLFAALFLLKNYPIGASILGLLGILIITAYEGTEVHPEDRTIREYNSFFFIKTGKVRKYGRIEGISIHKAKVSQKMFTPRTMNSSTFTHTEFNAYLLLYGGEKVFLFSGKDKLKVLARSRDIAGRLNTSVSDHAVLR